MSDRFPIVSGARMVKFLEKRGFRQMRRRGSHVILSAEGGDEFAVPDHKELKTGTAMSILRQAGIPREEFVRAMRSH